jgi:hypothetical protein
MFVGIKKEKRAGLCLLARLINIAKIPCLGKHIIRGH